jgi:hypothetical protein
MPLDLVTDFALFTGAIRAFAAGFNIGRIAFPHARSGRVAACTPGEVAEHQRLSHGGAPAGVGQTDLKW